MIALKDTIRNLSNFLTGWRAVSSMYSQVAREQSCADHVQNSSRDNMSSATWYEGAVQPLTLDFLVAVVDTFNSSKEISELSFENAEVKRICYCKQRMKRKLTFFSECVETKLCKPCTSFTWHPHSSCGIVWYRTLRVRFDRVGIAFKLALFSLAETTLFSLAETVNLWRRGRSRRKPLAISFRKCHIPKPED